MDRRPSDPPILWVRRIIGSSIFRSDNDHSGSLGRWIGDPPIQRSFRFVRSLDRCMSSCFRGMEQHRENIETCIFSCFRCMEQQRENINTCMSSCFHGMGEHHENMITCMFSCFRCGAASRKHENLYDFMFRGMD